MFRLPVLALIALLVLTGLTPDDVAALHKRRPTPTPKVAATATVPRPQPSAATTPTPTPRPSVTPTPMPTDTPTAQPSPTPTPRRILWGALVAGSPWDMAQQDAFETLVGRRASLIHLGISWYTWFGPTNGYLPATTLEAIRGRGALPEVSWFSADRSSGLTNASILNGDHDAYIHSFARTAAAWGQPLVLRFDSEFNGDWWGYSEGVNGNSVGSFAPMWRYVHTIFEAEGATNVIWAWIPNARGQYGQYPFASQYPGAAYVDWVGADGYNFNWGGDWQSFDQVFGATYHEIQVLAPDKPFMVGEFASSEAGDGGARKAAWITDALETQIPTRYPAITSINYYNIQDGEPWPVDTSALALDAFRRGISLDYYWDGR